MKTPTIHKIYDDNDNPLYYCSMCQEYLEPDLFYREMRLKNRDQYSYRCKPCLSELGKIKREPATDIRVLLNEIMERLGYDTSDLVNNPIHVQFNERYELWKQEQKIESEQEPIVFNKEKKWNIYNEGKRVKDMTPEEQKQYRKQAYIRHRERYHYGRRKPKQP